MLTRENIDKNVAEDEEKCAKGNSRRKGKELTSTEEENLLFDDNKMVNNEMVNTKSIKKVCSLRRTSKYGIERNSVNAAKTSIIK